MNFSIALHPGLEKTGTSSIQKFFRINANNYIGIPEKLQLVAGRHFLTKYRYVVLNKAPSWWFTKEGQKLLHQFENAFTKALNINPNQILISFENLLSHDYFLGTNKWIRSNSNETWTPVDHLKTLIDCTVLCEGSIKFLITVRRQSDWLASLYAQRSNLIRRANQSDFEEKISQILKMSPIPAPLNLNMLISEIEKK